MIEKLEKLADETNNKIAISIAEKVEQQKIPAKGKTVVDNSIMATLANPNFLQMKISLVGEYNTIMRFVKLLENFEYYNDVVAIQIVQDDSAGSIAKQNSANIGMLASPFDTSTVKTGEINEEIKDEGKKLKASLDTVFYVK